MPKGREEARGVPHHFEGQRKTMNTFMKYRFFFRSSFLLAILFLFLAGGSRANAQGSNCTSNSVPNDVRVAVTWGPPFCQELNCVALTAIDPTGGRFNQADNN